MCNSNNKQNLPTLTEFSAMVKHYPRLIIAKNKEGKIVIFEPENPTVILYETDNKYDAIEWTTGKTLMVCMAI